MNAVPPDNKVLDTDYSEVSGISEADREMLIEYQKLAKNLEVLSLKIGQLTSSFTGNILDDMQSVESKVSLVYTLLQASVYNVFVQNEGEFLGEDEDELDSQNDNDDSHY